MNLSNYLASGWSGTIHGVKSGRMVTLSIQAGGMYLPALGSGDPFVNVTNTLPHPFRSGGTVRFGTGGVNGFIGHVELNTANRLTIKNRSGVSWGTGTAGMSITYPSSQ